MVVAVASECTLTALCVSGIKLPHAWVQETGFLVTASLNRGSDDLYPFEALEHIGDFRGHRDAQHVDSICWHALCH